MPTLPALGGTTVNRKWIVEVNTGTSGSPVWTPVGGLTSVNPTFDNAHWEDDSDFAGGGYESQTKTSAGWSLACEVRRAPQQASSTAYDVGQEYLRSKAISVFGASNSVQVRVYEWVPDATLPRVEAYTGYCGVGWDEQGGAYNALSKVAVTLTGQGQLTPVAHPYPAAAAVPVITSATPLALGVAGGALVKIFGSGFAGTVATTGVKFAGTNAPFWSVENDNYIIAEAPAHAAGSGAIVVTNATGASTTGPSVTYS